MISGFAVIAVNRRDPENTEYTVADFNYDQGSPDTGYALVEVLRREFEDSDANTFHWQITEKHPMEGLASHIGFLNSRLVNHMSYTRGNGLFSSDEVLLGRCIPREVMFQYGDFDSV